MLQSNSLKAKWLSARHVKLKYNPLLIEIDGLWTAGKESIKP